MLINILILIGLIALAIGFGLLARAAWRSRRGIVRWPGLILSGLVALVFTAVSVVAILGLVRLNTTPYTYTSNAAAIPVTGATDQVKVGERKAALCTGCHSTAGKFPLDGSAENFFAGDGPPLGILYAPNLTPGGPLKDWSDAEIARAIREGVDKEGKPLLIMPSKALRNLSDEDTAALVAFLRSQPAVDRQVPEKQPSILAALLLGSGMFPTSAQPPIREPVQTPPSGTVQKGDYLVHAMGCIDCHGDNLAGAPPGGFGPPPGPNLTSIVPQWSQEAFVTFIRTGKDPSGRQISTDMMPWNEYNAALTDDELQDMHTYLHALPPLPNNQ